MSGESSPAVEAHELWRIPRETAIALVDEHIGPPESWSASPLMQYRLSSAFQSVWKAEVGHWLHAAEAHGALQKVLRPIFGERDRRRRNEVLDENDPRHLKLHQHLAAAMVCHYFTGLGWTCKGFDTETGVGVDIDVAFDEPGGNLVEFQVKAPDRPGRIENHRFVDGDFDVRVLKALDGAVDQLPKPARSVAMVALFARRNLSLAWDPGCVKRRVLGTTVQHGPEVYIDRPNYGQFLKGEWAHVAGVVILDLIVGMDTLSGGDVTGLTHTTSYPCVVLLNPNATHPANPDWFPKAHVAVLEGDTFRWIRGEPIDAGHGLPPGTRVVKKLPPL